MISSATDLRTKETDTGRVVTAPRSPELLLSVNGLSKKFCRSLKRSLFYGLQDVATEWLARRRRSERLRTGEFWALKDVSFQLHRGESVGLVGSNGAGKSTLLRVVTGLIKPDTGSVMVRGKVAPLIALGAGFSPVLTGRENVYANMSILGLTSAEIDRRFDAVLDFAEVSEALDAPVRTYSSGMAARLGFACAVYTDPDILLIDEVLAVGDVKFRMKCFRRLAELRDQGTAFILVSHNPHSIMSVCDSALYLSQGTLVASGPTDAILSRYERDLFSRGSENTSPNGAMSLPAKRADESTGLDILSLYFRNEDGNRLENPVAGSPATLCVNVLARHAIQSVGVNAIIREAFGETDVTLALDSRGDVGPMDLGVGQFEIQLRLPYCGLKPGLYAMKINLNRRGIDLFDGVEAFRFAVVDGQQTTAHGSFHQPRSWQITRLP